MADETFNGSCLCDSVHYTIKGEIRGFFHCHCRRCRKATGTGHASNVIVALASIDWSSGEELLQRYDVPEAKRFHSRYCGRCGSPMPRVASDGQVAVIPAGSLDDSPALTPSARIFQDSRSDWSCQGDDLPHWDQYPQV